MSCDKTTKTVFHMFMAWSSDKEERWLSEQERSGWHLKSVRCFGYTFERSAPADVAYRLDWGPSCRQDGSEYLNIFKDAGWEHLGWRGKWNVFRKPVVGGLVPEIYTDPNSRIAMYRRVLAFLGVFMCIIVAQLGPQISRLDSSAKRGGFPFVLAIYGAMVAFFLYGIVRLLLVISKLKKERTKLN